MSLNDRDRGIRGSYTPERNKLPPPPPQAGNGDAMIHIPIVKNDGIELMGKVSLPNVIAEELAQVVYAIGSSLMLTPTLVLDGDKAVIVSFRLTHEPSMP